MGIPQVHNHIATQDSFAIYGYLCCIPQQLVLVKYSCLRNSPIVLILMRVHIISHLYKILGIEFLQNRNH